jgi:HAD superfamily hydrolase (TIGR01459 family)
MTQLIRALSDVHGRYDALFCDLWGCLHNGVKAFPEAVTALQAFRAGGGAVVLLTNAPRPSSAVIQQLDRLQVPRDAYDLVVSSGDASREAMINGMVGTKVWHLGPSKDDSFFTDTSDGLDASAITRVPLEEAEGIVCTGLFDEDTEQPDDYRGRFLLAKTKGLKMICTNPDIVVDMGDKRIWCAGALAQLYEEMGGEVMLFGKPWPPIYDLARRKLNELREVADEGILCVGDGPLTDIKGGLAEGLDTCFITGGLAAEELGAKPDEAAITAYLQRDDVSATLALPKLR